MSEARAVATLTFSDTRTDADDEGGLLLGDLLRAAAFDVVEHRIVREDVETMRSVVRELAARTAVEAIVTTGGTGLGPRDMTLAALEPLFTKPVVGFGEAFRRLSWDEIGARAVLSNATGGVVGQTIVLALPGSPKALKLAVPKLVVPMLPHAIDVARGRVGHHGAPKRS